MTTQSPVHPSHAAAIKDPICGMAVDPKTAMHAEYLGTTSYFCSAACKKTFIDQHAGKTTATNSSATKAGTKSSGTKLSDKSCC